jgi:hypothetical protein
MRCTQYRLSYCFGQGRYWNAPTAPAVLRLCLRSPELDFSVHLALRMYEHPGSRLGITA